VQGRWLIPRGLEPGVEKQRGRKGQEKSKSKPPFTPRTTAVLLRFKSEKNHITHERQKEGPNTKEEQKVGISLPGRIEMETHFPGPRIYSAEQKKLIRGGLTGENASLEVNGSVCGDRFGNQHLRLESQRAIWRKKGGLRGSA